MGFSNSHFSPTLVVQFCLADHVGQGRQFSAIGAWQGNGQDGCTEPGSSCSCTDRDGQAADDQAQKRHVAFVFCEASTPVRDRFIDKFTLTHI